MRWKFSQHSQEMQLRGSFVSSVPNYHEGNSIQGISTNNHDPETYVVHPLSDLHNFLQVSALKFKLNNKLQVTSWRMQICWETQSKTILWVVEHITLLSAQIVYTHSTHVYYVSKKQAPQTTGQTGISSFQQVLVRENPLSL